MYFAAAACHGGQCVISPSLWSAPHWYKKSGYGAPARASRRRRVCAYPVFVVSAGHDRRRRRTFADWRQQRATQNPQCNEAQPLCSVELQHHPPTAPTARRCVRRCDDPPPGQHAPASNEPRFARNKLPYGPSLPAHM